MIRMMLRRGWESDQSIGYKVAYIFSRLFDTTILSLAIFWIFASTVELQVWWLLILIIGDFILPVGYLIYGFYMRKMSDLDVTDREERVRWYVLMAFSWSTTLIFIIGFNIQLPENILIYQVWLTVFGVINASITLVWKISAHAMLSTSLTLWLVFLKDPIFIIMLITFVPIIYWARLRTRKHTLLQLIAGTLLMLIIIPVIWHMHAI